MSELPPAGWYPDTTQPGQQRYWDGAAWTDHMAPLATAAPVATGHWPRLAGFGQRLGAAVIDGLVLSIPVFVLMGLAFALFFAGSSVTMQSLEVGGPTMVEGDLVGGGFLAGFAGLMLVMVLIGLIAPFLYSVGYEGSPLGQTIGKWAVGIRVVDGPTAGRLPPSRAFVRVLVRSFASGFLALGYLWMLWDDQNRCWHDLAADSRVVVVDGPKPSFGTLLRSWSLRS